jgi:septum formation protein
MKQLRTGARQREILLASSSPRRIALLRGIGLKFRVEPSGDAERDQPHLSPRELALRHAFAKARAVAERFPEAVVIGADTIVVLGCTVFGKPRNMADARRMLRQLQGRTHRVITGVCVLRRSARKRLLFAETSAVTFRKLTAEQIEQYLRRVRPLDKAGAYAAQHRGREIIARVDGSYSNVVGFPLERFQIERRRAGIFR